jgi:hypothetical protein
MARLAAKIAIMAGAGLILGRVFIDRNPSFVAEPPKSLADACTKLTNLPLCDLEAAMESERRTRASGSTAGFSVPGVADISPAGHDAQLADVASDTGVAREAPVTLKAEFVDGDVVDRRAYASRVESAVVPGLESEAEQ